MARTRVDDKSSIIAESAARLFRDRGIADVSIEDIAAAAGIAKGTFYLYFRTRDDLVEKLATKLVDQMVRSAETAGRHPGNGLDRFAAAVIKARGSKSAFLAYRKFPGHLCISINEEVVKGIGGQRVIH